MRFARFHRRKSLPAGPESDPDSRLVSLAQQDPAAFALIYDRYFPGVFGYCLKSVRDPELAADISAQTFLKAVASLGQYREHDKFRNWLYTIAHHLIVDLQTNRSRLEPLDAATNYPDPSPSPEAIVMSSIGLELLELAIAQLPGVDRQVLALRCNGMSGQEIARTLGISHEAAKKRQLRAIARLREIIAAKPYEPEVRREA